MKGTDPAAPAAPSSEVDKLRRRVEALSRKRDEAEARLRALLSSLLPLDDLLADTRRRAGALHEARSAREAASAAIALSEQIDAAHLMLRGEFARHDVSQMHVVGRAADPAEMRVVGTEAHPSALDGTVLRERLTGFRLGTSTLRPAQVVIAVAGVAPEPRPEPEPVPGLENGADPAAPGATKADSRGRSHGPPAPSGA